VTLIDLDSDQFSDEREFGGSTRFGGHEQSWATRFLRKTARTKKQSQEEGR